MPGPLLERALGSFGEASREHYARLYAHPGVMRAGFNQFAAFDKDAIDNQAFVAQGLRAFLDRRR